MKFIKHLIMFVLIISIILIGYHSFASSNQQTQNDNWQAGTPAILNAQTTWLSQPYHQSTSGFQRNVAVISKHESYNPVPLMYNANGKLVSHGNVGSASIGQNPFFRQDNRNTYTIISGTDSPSQDEKDLHTMQTPVEKITLKVLNHNQIKIINGQNKQILTRSNISYNQLI